jgi:hypothetical protein
MRMSKKAQIELAKLQAELDEIARRGVRVETAEELDQKRSAFIARNNRPPSFTLFGIFR